MAVKPPGNIALNNGQSIPNIGLGTYLGEDLEKVIEYGIDIGYRLFDTAAVYQNEPQIGKCLKRVLNDDDAKVKRDDLFIVSKLWNTHHRKEDVLSAIKKSLSDLQLNYLDLYLIHWPFAQKVVEGNIFDYPEDDVSIEETYLAMEECVKLGLTKSIGLSNFNKEQIEKVLKVATIKPVINQVECNPYLNQEKLRKYCAEKDIVIMAYSPFFGRNRYGSNSHGLDLFEEPVIKSLAEKYNKKSSQIVMRYLVQCGVVPIPKTDKLDRLKENFEIFDFELLSDEMENVKLLNNNLRCTDFAKNKHFKEYPFNAEY